MKVLYLDCSNSGIAGDIFLASLLGLIPNQDEILLELEDLKNYLEGVSSLDIKLIKKERSGINVNRLKIDIKEDRHHRTPESMANALERFLSERNYSNEAKNYANGVLNSLFRAEAEVHGEPIEKIHLHELSSVDTLVDIVGVTKILDQMGIFQKEYNIYYGKIPLGGGTVKTAHGIIPVPAPATVKILENSNLVVSGGPIESELTTPTGAALISKLNPKFMEHPNKMKITNVTYSTGEKEFNDFLNVFRLFSGIVEQDSLKAEHFELEKYIQTISVLETNVDDVSGEIIGHFINKLEEYDIFDIQVIASVTKKNRPGYIIKVYCKPEINPQIILLMMKELGTLGVRINTLSRVCVDREIQKRELSINNQIFEVNFKISYLQAPKEKSIVNIKPEYEDLKNISEKTGLGLKELLIRANKITEQISKDFTAK